MAELQSHEISEIEEGYSSTDLFEIKEEAEGSLFSYDIHSYGENADVVYVGVGKSEQLSKEALVWTLNHAVNPSSTVVYLIHVFPQLHFIPTPLGKLPISQVNPEQKENYMNQERSKRSHFLHKFLNMCSTAQVKVETVLIESDTEAKAILDLIPILNIRKLVLGTTKSSTRKSKSGTGSGNISDEIVQNAPEYCDVKIICEGKEVCEEKMIDPPTPLASTSPFEKVASLEHRQEEDSSEDLFSCSCFKAKVVS